MFLPGKWAQNDAQTTLKWRSNDPGYILIKRDAQSLQQLNIFTYSPEIFMRIYHDIPGEVQMTSWWNEVPMGTRVPNFQNKLNLSG